MTRTSEKTPNPPCEQTVALTSAQAVLLARAQEQVTIAQLALSAQLRMVLAQYNIPEARVIRITDTDPPQLVLALPALEPALTGT